MASMELKDFIHKVRDEIKAAYEERPEKPILALTAVDLEISFSLSGKGGAKGKLLVVDLEGEVSTERTHKVTLHLVPHDIPSEGGAKRTATIDLDKLGRLPIAGVDIEKARKKML
ncbi:MAG: hypothetical protein KJZ74_14965 [Gemmatimonadales bacterium]|nr:hypothetical protein [Gemmatimonadales bacterium]